MQQLTGLDQMFLSLDSATTNAVLGGLVRFDPPAPGAPVPDEAFMRARLTEHLPLIPPMNKRVVTVPFALDHSYLATCERIDVGDRITTVVLPGAGGDVELAAEVSRIMGTPLITDGPLWDYTIITGLDDGGIAHLLRIHHGMVDGSTMPDIWDLFADEPVATLPDTPPLRTRPEPVLGKSEMAVRGVTGTLARPVK